MFRSKTSIKIEPEMVLNPQENVNLTVKSEIPDSYEAVSSPAISWIKQEIEMEGNSPEYVDVSVNSEELDLYQRESVCDLPFIKEEPESARLCYDSLLQLTKEIVNLTHQVGFTDVDEEDVSALLQTQEEDDLLSMEDENCVEVSKEDKEPKCVKVLTGKGMSEAFQMINIALSYFENNDPDETRSRKVKREVEHVIKCCRELYNSKLKSSVSNELETSFSESSENVGHEY
uniref:Uncharacterized protein n=1 Tax=Timema tahoe TaxID=61484 RepID=A0A7R9NZK3_9NEOP|nr:unnamed protein product [Timema tahoe]